jgi:hypothetical protein
VCHTSYSREKPDRRHAPGYAGASFVQGLHESIVKSRSAIILLSRDSGASDALAGTVSEALSSAGLRLVGDAEDRGEYDLGRIGGIMDGCGAYAAALPYRPSGPGMT